MRARGDRVIGLLELDPAHDFAAVQIQFGDLRCIPQAAPGAAAVARGYAGIGERRRDEIACAQVEALEHFAACDIEQHGVVGEIVGHEEAVFVVTSGGNQGQSCRIRNRGAWRRLP